MKRTWTWSALAAALAIGVLAGPATRADEKAKEKEKQTSPERRHRVDVRTIGGGSYLGVGLDDLDQDDVVRLKLPGETGVRVARVEEDSPAAKAGVKVDDVIVRFVGEPVRSAAHLSRLVRETPEGRKVDLDVIRAGSTVKLSATLDEVAFGDRIRREVDRAMAQIPNWVPEAPELPDLPDLPHPPRAPMAPRAPMPPHPPMLRWHSGDGNDFAWEGFAGGPLKLGVNYQEVEGQLGQFLKVTGGKGILVTEVKADSPASKAGVKAGDVIVKLDGKDVSEGDDFRRAIRESKPGQEVTLGLSREGRVLDLKVKLADEEKPRVRRGPTT